MNEVGKTEENPDAKGSAFLTPPQIKDYVSTFKTCLDRVTKMKADNATKGSVTVMHAMHHHPMQRMKN